MDEDDIGSDGRQRRIVDTELHEPLAGKIRNHDVGGCDQPAQDFASPSRHGIKRQAPLVAVPLQEAGAIVSLRTREVLESVVAAFDSLDADDVGSEVGEHGGAHRSCDVASHVDHPDSAQHHHGSSSLSRAARL